MEKKDNLIKRISLDVKQIVDERFSGTSYQLKDVKGKLHTVKPKTYFVDNTDTDDCGDIGYQVRVMLEKPTLFGFGRLENYIGDFSILEGNKKELSISLSHSNTSETRKPIEDIIETIQNRYDVQIPISYFSAEEYHETGGGFL